MTTAEVFDQIIAEFPHFARYRDRALFDGGGAPLYSADEISCVRAMLLDNLRDLHGNRNTSAARHVQPRRSDLDSFLGTVGRR